MHRVLDYGSVLLRLLYPNGQEIHFSLPDIGNPKFIELAAGMQRCHGVPILTSPNPRFHRNYDFQPITGTGKVIAFPAGRLERATPSLAPTSQAVAAPVTVLPALPDRWKP